MVHVIRPFVSIVAFIVNFIKSAILSNSQERPLNRPPLLSALFAYFEYGTVFLFRCLEHFLVLIAVRKGHQLKEKNRDGYVPLYERFGHFFLHNVIRSGIDMYNNPIASMAGAQVTIIDRISNDFNVTFRYGDTIEAVNLGSYNYLGLNQNNGPITECVSNVIREFGVNVGSTRLELGTLSLHKELEYLWAKFLGTEDCIVFGMGFATNSATISALFDKQTLIISDENNHASIAKGCKLSGSVIVKFKHNDMNSLEQCLIRGVQRNTKNDRKWKRIVVIVEGVYSMEGTIVNFPEVIRLKKKYKAYLYLDEAHSIGAIGNNGRGVVDFFGVNIKDVDVMMGTFTKSFAAAGGYIAGRKHLVDYLRVYSCINCYAASIAPPILQQIICSITIVTKDANLIERLAENTKYFRQRLKQFGFVILGNEHSPAVPVMVFLPCKLHYFIIEMKRQGVAAAAAGPPAVPINELRARFCVSAAHSKEMLDQALNVIYRVGKRAYII